MMNHKHQGSVFLLVLTSSLLCAKKPQNIIPKKPIAEWSILTHMQANNDLAEYAYYSLAHMESGMQKKEGVNVLAQWDDPVTKTIKRCEVVPGEMEIRSTLAKEQYIDPVKALVSGMQWVSTEYPARHYMLILWNHGTGVIDYDMPRSARSPLFFRSLQFKSPSVRPLMRDILQKERGILYDDTYDKVLTNQGLVLAMKSISDVIGKKIDVVVMDACFMAMFEIGHAIKESAQFLVASQEAESGGGLPYGLFIYPLTLQPQTFDPLAIAQTIVHTYGMFYQAKDGFGDYTYSAVDLGLMDDIKTNIDMLLKNIEACRSCNTDRTTAIIKSARTKTHEFWWNIYIDIYSFYDELSKNVGQEFANRSAIDDYGKTLVAMQATLTQGMRLIRSAVVANVAGPMHAVVKGMSIYYPIEENIHSSYASLPFAQSSTWEKFISTYR